MPSRRALTSALDAWGADSNLFHQGAATETDDPDVVAATMAKPGVVLKRPVGSNGAFTEQAELPKTLPLGKAGGGHARPKSKSKPESKPKAKQASQRRGDDKAAREAVINLEKERKKREAERRKEEAARDKQRKRREQAITKAEAALEEAKQKHQSTIDDIENQRAALDERAQAEEARWQKQRKTLQDDLRRARN